MDAAMVIDLGRESLWVAVLGTGISSRLGCWDFTGSNVNTGNDIKFYSKTRGNDYCADHFWRLAGIDYG